MTLEQIQYFVASAETGSFSAAARRLFVSHSSVSRSVSALERELGVTLFVRERRSLRCTPGGAAFLDQGRDLLHQAAALRDSMAEYREQKRLRITSISAHVPKAYELIRQFRAAHPEVELELVQTDQNTVIEQLLHAETDLVIGFSYTIPEDPSLEFLAVEQGRFCALMSPNHPLAKRAFLTRADIQRAPALLGENPFRDEPAKRPDTVQDVQSIILQIKAGSGITILPEHAAVEFGQGCVLIPIRDDTALYQLQLSWRNDNDSAPLQTAVHFFQSHIEKERA